MTETFADIVLELRRNGGTDALIADRIERAWAPIEHEVQRLRFEGKRLADVGQELKSTLQLDAVIRARRSGRYVAERVRSFVDELISEIDLGTDALTGPVDDEEGV